MSVASTLDADLLKTMTPEERAAIEGADADEIASLKAIAGGSADGAAKPPVEGKGADDGADDDDGTEDDDGTDDTAAAAPPPAAAPAPAAAAPAPAAAEDDDDAAPAPFVYRFQLPADFEEKLTANRTAREAVYAELKAGDISVDELPAKLAAIDDEARQLDSMRTQAQIAADSAQQAAEASKMAEVNRLFARAAKPEHGGINYKGDAAATKDLDLFVRALANDEANADKPLRWFMEEGHRRVLALRGKASPAPSPAPAPAPASTSRKPPIDAVPQGLANVPGGDGAGDVGGEFDDVMALEGEELEDALMAMSKRDPARFSRFQAMR